jgi:hypothetical protein
VGRSAKQSRANGLMLSVKMTHLKNILGCIACIMTSKVRQYAFIPMCYLFLVRVLQSVRGRCVVAMCMWSDIRRIPPRSKRGATQLGRLDCAITLESLWMFLYSCIAMLIVANCPSTHVLTVNFAHQCIAASFYIISHELGTVQLLLALQTLLSLLKL